MSGIFIFTFGNSSITYDPIFRVNGSLLHSLGAGSPCFAITSKQNCAIALFITYKPCKRNEFFDFSIWKQKKRIFIKDVSNLFGNASFFQSNALLLRFQPMWPQLQYPGNNSSFLATTETIKKRILFSIPYIPFPYTYDDPRYRRVMSCYYTSHKHVHQLKCLCMSGMFPHTVMWNVSSKLQH